MAHGDAKEGKWRGNWRMEWVASTLHTTSEHGVSVDAHTSAASIRLNWRPRRFKWTSPFHRKTKTGFCACHHISNAVYLPRYHAAEDIFMPNAHISFALQLIHTCHATPMPLPCRVAIVPLRSRFQNGMVGTRQGRGISMGMAWYVCIKHGRTV